MSHLRPDEEKIDLFAFVEDPKAPEFAEFRRGFVEYLKQEPERHALLTEAMSIGNTPESDVDRDEPVPATSPQERDETRKVALLVGMEAKRESSLPVAGAAALLCVVGALLFARRSGKRGSGWDMGLGWVRQPKELPAWFTKQILTGTCMTMEARTPSRCEQQRPID